MITEHRFMLDAWRHGRTQHPQGFTLQRVSLWLWECRPV